MLSAAIAGIPSLELIELLQNLEGKRHSVHTNLAKKYFKINAQDIYITMTSSSSSSASSSSSTEEAEQWSLRVRLLSAVDLPPSLSPAVPLCPWFKFGVVDDIVAAMEGGDDNDSNDSHDDGSGQRHSRTILPQRHDDINNDDDDDDPYNTKSTANKTKSNTKNNNPIQHLLQTHIPPNQQRTSTHKLMTKSTNGGGGNGTDWNEEYRWDDLSSPMDSALVLQLCTRLAPESGSISSSRGGTNNNNSGNNSRQEEDFNSSSDANSSDEMSHLTSGIRGLWRKSKKEHRRTKSSSSVVTQKEQQAANVAQFLMKSDGQVEEEEEEGGLVQGDLVEYQQQWSERRSGGGESLLSHDGSGSGSGMGDDGMLTEDRVNNRKKKKKQLQQHDNDDHYQYSEGLCLGTLSIPFNKLPLEDAVCGNGAAIVERWYQLDDPNTSSSATINNTSSHAGGEGGSLSGSLGDNSNDEDEPTLLHGPRRCPSVLLEITFASTEYLDEVEDEMYGLGGGAKKNAVIDLSAWEEKENVDVSSSSSPPPPPPPPPKEESNDKTKKEEGPKKPEDPELEPGVVDFICVVGAKDIGDQRNDDGSKGWVQSTPECCVLERFPPNDEFHINNGRSTGLPPVESFCFPEGCQLWRGPNAPTHDELKAGGVSTMTHPSSLDLSSNNFDTCLDTTVSFSWFVLSSNSDIYGSKLVKTYGTIIRFYVPAPKGIDPRQDDFAQMLTGGGDDDTMSGSYQKRLWVPIGICLTTVS